MYYFMVVDAFIVHSKLGALCADTEDMAVKIHADLSSAFAIFESGVSVQIHYEDEDPPAGGGSPLLPIWANTSLVLPALVEEDFDRLSRPMWD
jgi:hypothetical protein